MGFEQSKNRVKRRRIADRFAPGMARTLAVAAAFALALGFSLALSLGSALASRRPPGLGQGGAGIALAAERVLEPDRVYVAAQPPKSIDPLLEEGENLRSSTRYRDKTTALAVTQDDLYKGFLVLVNFAHPLPDGYAPEDLAISNELADSSGPAGFRTAKADMLIHKTAGESLLALAEAAYHEGVAGFLLQSGFRDYAHQSYLHQRKVQDYRSMGYGEDGARAAASFWVAKPGESEHQTGLALDLSSQSHPDLKLSYAHMANGRWLAEHAWQFGFILRYPEDKSEITKIGFEPWHIRYVGRPHSDVIAKNGWCLEEYLDFLREEGGYTFRDDAGAIWQIDYQRIVDGTVPVPADRAYTASGDGEGGIIVSVQPE